jgi:hypothetical protein
MRYIAKFYVADTLLHNVTLNVCENPGEPGYNDIGLSDTPYISWGILRYQLIPGC